MGQSILGESSNWSDTKNMSNFLVWLAEQPIANLSITDVVESLKKFEVKNLDSFMTLPNPDCPVCKGKGYSVDSYFGTHVICTCKLKPACKSCNDTGWIGDIACMKCGTLVNGIKVVKEKVSVTECKHPSMAIRSHTLLSGDVQHICGLCCLTWYGDWKQPEPELVIRMVEPTGRKFKDI